MQRAARVLDGSPLLATAPGFGNPDSQPQAAWPDARTVVPIRHAFRAAGIRVAMIMPQGLGRRGLIALFARLHPEFVIAPFDSVADCISLAAQNLDLILYWPSADTLSDIGLIKDVKALRQAFEAVAVAVLA
jgi:hypothetical protein